MVKTLSSNAGGSGSGPGWGTKIPDAKKVKKKNNKERNTLLLQNTRGFPGGSDGKQSTCNAGDLGSIPGSGGSTGEGNGNPLQYSCLENPMDRGVWQATVHGIKESNTTERLTHTYF